jgi:sialic acid synthase SpsE
MTEFIAEIGLNHLGDEDRASRMLAASLDANVDCVTFQIREPKFYESTERSHRPLSMSFYQSASRAVREAGKKFGVAIADETKVAALDGIGVDFWKTLSWDFGNLALRRTLFNTGCPVFLSTGLSSTAEVVAGSKDLNNAILIHTQLTQDLSEVNLKAIPALAKATNLPVAFGLHAANHDVLKMALSFEPHSIFFYVKELGEQFLFDNQHALALSGLAEDIRELKELMAALGIGQKAEMGKPAWVVE